MRMRAVLVGSGCVVVWSAQWGRDVGGVVGSAGVGSGSCGGGVRRQVLAYQVQSVTNRWHAVRSRPVWSAGDVVAVAVGWSVESVVAVWGVVKSGAAFVPVDPKLPADRIAFMVADSAVSVVSPLRRCVVVCLITGG